MVTVEEGAEQGPVGLGHISCHRGTGRGTGCYTGRVTLHQA